MASPGSVTSFAGGALTAGAPPPPADAPAGAAGGTGGGSFGSSPQGIRDAARVASRYLTTAAYMYSREHPFLRDEMTTGADNPGFLDEFAAERHELAALDISAASERDGNLAAAYRSYLAAALAYSQAERPMDAARAGIGAAIAAVLSVVRVTPVSEFGTIYFVLNGADVVVMDGAPSDVSSVGTAISWKNPSSGPLTWRGQFADTYVTGLEGATYAEAGSIPAQSGFARVDSRDGVYVRVVPKDGELLVFPPYPVVVREKRRGRTTIRVRGAADQSDMHLALEADGRVGVFHSWQPDDNRSAVLLLRREKVDGRDEWSIVTQRGAGEVVKKIIPRISSQSPPLNASLGRLAVKLPVDDEGLVATHD